MFHMKTIKGNKKIGNEIGRLGESVACRFLTGKGFTIIDRNYQKKWGEIDIVARRGNKVYFVEVKSVSCEKGDFVVTHETSGKYRPEDNVHPAKLKRIARTIQSYLASENISPETLWQFDLITVKLDFKNREAKVFLMDNLII